MAALPKNYDVETGFSGPESVLREISDHKHDTVVGVAGGARGAISQLKAMAHENRLAILFHLYFGPKSVRQLEQLLAMRQPAVSQQLARLRSDHMVKTERRGKQVYYSIANEDAFTIVDMLCRIYCPDTIKRR